MLSFSSIFLKLGLYVNIISGLPFEPLDDILKGFLRKGLGGAKKAFPVC
jgi:hypothetical protein